MSKTKLRQMQREQARAKKARQRTFLYAGVIAAVALIVIGIGVVLAQPKAPSGGDTTTPVAPGAVTCSDIQNLPDEGNHHLAPGDPVPNYQTNPPTSGNHNPLPMPPGVYNDPIDVTREVHSMEHGYVIIHYNKISSDEIQQLTNLVSKDAFKLILSPYPNMPYRVSLTAWTHTQTCNGVNVDAITNFIARFRDRGPEATPM